MRLSWIALLPTLILATTADASAMDGTASVAQKRITHRSGEATVVAGQVSRGIFQPAPAPGKEREAAATPELVSGGSLLTIEAYSGSPLVQHRGVPAASRAGHLPDQATAPLGALTSDSSSDVTLPASHW